MRRTRRLILPVVLGIMVAVSFVVRGGLIEARTFKMLRLAANSPTAPDLVAQALENEPNLNYSGTQVVILWPGPDATVMTVRVNHKSPNITRTEYFDAWDHPIRVVLANNSITWRYEMEEQTVYVSRATNPAPSRGSGITTANGIRELQKNYTFRIAGKDEVAGREAYVVSILPKYEGNPSKKIWIDAKSPLILREEKYRSDGSLAFLWYYTSLQFNPGWDEDDFKIRIPPGVRIVDTPGGERFAPIDTVSSLVPFPIALPDYVPAGYELKGARIATSPAGRTVHTLYSDGFNTISLFQALKTPGGSGTFGTISKSEVRRVEINGQEGELVERYDGNILLWKYRGYELALVGDINTETLVKMARSIMPKEAPKESYEQNARARDWPVIIWRVIYRFLWAGEW